MRYARVIEVIDQVSEAVAGWGVRVVRDVDLQGLRPLLDRFGVVTLVTHWRAYRFGPWDLVDAAGLSARVRSSPDPLSASLRLCSRRTSGRPRLTLGRTPGVCHYGWPSH